MVAVEQRHALRTVRSQRSQLKQPWRSDMMRANWADAKWRKERVAAAVGHEISDQTRQRISEALTGRPHTEAAKRKMSEVKGGIKVQTYWLFSRGALIDEVVAIAGVSRIQAERQRDDLRKRGGLSQSSPEYERIRKSRAHREKFKRASDEAYAQDQQRREAFAGKLHDAGLITEDLSCRTRLTQLYEKRKRAFPEHVADHVRLEVFFAAVDQKERGNTEMLAVYKKLGGEVDRLWFASSLAEEETFVAAECVWQSFLSNISQPDIDHMYTRVYWKNGCNRQAAEDTAQAALLNIFRRSRPPMIPATKEKRQAFFNRVADNQFLDEQRRRGRERRILGVKVSLDPTFPSHDGTYWSAEHEAIPREELGRIEKDPTTPREILLYAREDLSLREIAAMEGKTVTAVKATMHRWREKHRELREEI